MKTIKELHDMDLEFVKEAITKRGRLSSQINVFWRGNVMPLLITTEITDELLRATATMAKSKKAHAISIFSEAWFSRVPKGQLASAPKPSKDPNRKECAIIITYTKNDKRITILELKRTESEKIVITEVKDNSDIKSAGGRFDILQEGLYD